MRYIDISKLKVSANWEKKAKALNKALDAAKTKEERKIIIDKNPIWQDLFIPLSDLSNSKCWYSEARDIMSSRDIDHFRPKNEAKNVDNIPRLSEEGYWWLTYDFENYRFSSEYSNRLRKDKFSDKKQTGGKSSYFPLFEHSPVAIDKQRCADEDIMLLDPCDEDDPGLMTFDQFGDVIPNTVSVREKKRVEISIRLYNLDHTPLKEERQKLWKRCCRIIDEIRHLANLPSISISNKARIKVLRQEIREISDRESELSAVAMACCEQNGLGHLVGSR